jgi:hypothetical protein
MTVEARVARNVELAPLHLEGDEREAARLLFSLLAHVETVAIVAAQRGGGVREQLEDELVHHESFKRIAEQLGGLEPRFPELQELISYIDSLEGDVSLAILNIVAEGWIANVFRSIASWRYLSPELWQIVGAEEERHCHEALEMARPDPEQTLPYLRQIEEHIYEVGRHPRFLLPLSFLGGVENVARMGLGSVEQHRRACAHLGVEPGEEVRDMEKSCRAALLQPLPEEVEPNAFQVSAMRMWKQPAPITDFVSVHLPGSHADREARVVQALAAVLARYPELNRTVAAGKLYRPPRVRIGVRRLYDNADLITTVYVADPHRLSVGLIKARLRRRMERIREHPYEPAPDLTGLEQFLPGPACVATVSYCAHFGVEHGQTAFSPWEGSTISLGVGQDPTDPDRLILGITCDHRVFGGRHVGLLVREIKKEFQEG